MKKEKVAYIILTILILSIGGVYGLVRWDSLKEINKIEIDTNAFIDCVDEVSANKVQVNWKHVAAVIGVIEKNDFKKVNDLEIIEFVRYS